MVDIGYRQNDVLHFSRVMHQQGWCVAKIDSPIFQDFNEAIYFYLVQLVNYMQVRVKCDTCDNFYLVI